MTDQLPELALYHFPSCGYCKRVRRVVAERLSGRRRNLHLLLFILGVALALVAQLVARF